MLRKILFIAGFLWWVETMWFIYSATRGTQPILVPELDIVVVGELEKQEWFSIYLQGEKVGYASKALQTIGTKTMVTDVSYLRLPVGGVIQEVYAQGIITTDSNFAIRSFSFDIQGGDYNATAEGAVREKELFVVVNTPESRDSLSFPLNGDIYSASLIPEMFVSALKSKKPLDEIPTFDPFSLSESRYRIISARRSRRKAMGVEHKAWHLSVSAMGIISEMWISDAGELLYETGPGGFAQFREDQKSALAFDLSQSGNTDILTGFAISASWEYTISPRSVKYAEYKMEGFPMEILELEDFNQRLSGDTLFVCADGIGFGEPPVPEDTAEVPFVQCHDRRMVKAVEKIAKNETDTIKILSKINRYLFNNIKKEYQTSLPSALDVLDKMRGDCNEHSTLFVALARALGIPARINVGVVYREDGYFLYHAWVQCFAGGRWHSFDPTFGQAPADAAHIKFLSGSLDKQVQLLRIGQVDINVLEAMEKCHQ